MELQSASPSNFKILGSVQGRQDPVKEDGIESEGMVRSCRARHKMIHSVTESQCGRRLHGGGEGAAG